MQLKIIIEPDEDVFVAYCPQLPGCVTYGKDRHKAFANIREAIDLYLRPIPQLNKITNLLLDISKIIGRMLLSILFMKVNKPIL